MFVEKESFSSYLQIADQYFTDFLFPGQRIKHRYTQGFNKTHL